jgi:hypothetical protein
MYKQISTRWTFAAVALAVLCWVIVPGAAVLRAAEDEILPELPEKLRLPPGLEQVLPLNKRSSFFGDTLRAVDCPNDNDLPYGTCGNLLFGGLVMTDSHLSGNLRIRFFPPANDISHFEVIHGTLHGDDSVLVSPLGYELPVLGPEVADAPFILSRGDLDLKTGGVKNFEYFLQFRNSAINKLLDVNPKVDRPIVVFPGIRGHAWARFTQRPDGRLDFTMRGSTFLALGKEALGEVTRFPMPFCNPLHCASVPARGTSLHPHIYLSTKEPEGAPCAPNCPEIPTNTVREFTLFAHSSSFGDNFDLDIPALGGTAAGRSHIVGRLQIQFGPPTGDTVSFVIQSLVPEGLLAKPPSSALGPGFQPSLLGQEEFLRFPLQTYRLKGVAVVEEPFNIVHGAVDLRTGRVIGEMEWPAFFVQNLALALFEQNDGRISTNSFPISAFSRRPDEQQDTYALFERGPNGQLTFRYSGRHKRSFATFRFPSPDLVKANSYLAGVRATLDLFFRVQAVSTSDTPRVRLNGGATNVTSSVGDRFSYSYSVPCAPEGESFSFDYTNQNSGKSGGTFRMNRLAAVKCFNSRTSTLPPGDYDTVTFSGFGTWSKDEPDSKPRFAVVHVSTSRDFPYVSILVFQDPDPDDRDNPVVSGANTKPAERPFP